MSGAYFIVLDTPDAGFDTFVNGKFLFRHATTLDHICQELRLKTLNEYVSQSQEDARITIEEYGGDPESIEIPEEHWFAIEEGVEFTTRLSAHIKTYPQCVRNSAELLSDLQEYLQVFEQARQVHAKWHLDVDF